MPRAPLEHPPPVLVMLDIYLYGKCKNDDFGPNISAIKWSICLDWISFMNIYDFRIHQSIYCKIILTFCWIKFSNISEEIFWRLLMFYQKEIWAKGRNWGVKMRRIVTNEVTTSQGFDARRRNEGMVGIGFQRGSLSGSGGHLGVWKYDWQADGRADN